MERASAHERAVGGGFSDGSAIRQAGRLKASIAAPGPFGSLQTALLTARKSAPASISGLALSNVIPPIATHGISVTCDHFCSVSELRHMLHLLCTGWIECSEGHIIGTCFCAFLRRWRLLWQVTPICASLPRISRASRTSPSPCPRCTPSALSRFAKATLSLIMNATSCAAQTACNGSANAAASCWSMPFTRN